MSTNLIEIGLDQHQFVVHYQPIVDLTTMLTAGYEALIRWQHPVQGLLYPESFIESAEKDPDTIFKMFKFAISTAINDRTKLGFNKFLAVNLSANSLLHNSFPSVLIGHKDNNIVLEITERIALDYNSKEQIKRIALIGELNYPIAIDDFGVPSFMQIVDCIAAFGNPSKIKVKLDMKFAQSIHKNMMFEIVETVILGCHKLKTQVVAEGIETQDQLDFMRDAGCDYGQGYLFGKPKPLDC